MRPTNRCAEPTLRRPEEPRSGIRENSDRILLARPDFSRSRLRAGARSSHARCWGLVVMLAVATIGCTALPGTVPDVRPERLKRAKDAAKSFDERRDEVEFQAATTCWRHDDAEGCRHLLNRLLKRNAEHLPARLLMTETYLVADQLDEARQTFEPAQKTHGDDPRVLHMAGMLAEAAGDSRQALANYQRAAKLAPGDEMYRLSYESAKEDLNETEPAQLAKRSAGAKSPPEKSAANKKRSDKPEGQPARQASRDAKRRGNKEREARQTAGVAPPSDARGGAASSDDNAAAGNQSSQSAPRRVGSRKNESTADRPILRSRGPEQQLSFTDEASPSMPSEADHGAASKPSVAAADETRLSDLPEAAKKLLAKADAALAADAVDSARRFFRQARQAARQEPRVAISAAVMAIRHDELELAAEVAGDGLKAFPRSAGLYRVLGTARYRLGDYSAAREAFDEAITLDNSQALSYFLMGSTLLKLGQPEAAERHFQQARRLDPRYARPATG